MKNIEWVSDEEKFLPGYGKMKKGTVKNVPNKLADNLIKQKIVKEVKPVKEKK